MLNVLLVGRPNAGKSSIYNALTGGNAKIGNFPGVTVDVIEGEATLPSGTKARVIDLPGIYSLDQAADPESDEGQARKAIEEVEQQKTPSLILQIVDATQLLLGLRMTAELEERTIPVVVLVTQRDMLESEGKRLDEEVLRASLGERVLVVSARDRDVRERVLFALDRAHEGTLAGARTGATKIDAAKVTKEALKDVEGKKSAARKQRSHRERSQRLDAVFLHPVFGPILFLSLMTLLFSAVFLVADPASAIFDRLLKALAAVLAPLLGNGWLASLVNDGVLGGAGTVLAFLPQIVILTAALEVIDASGYLARGAFLVDRTFRFAGLGGRSFVPLLTAHACAIPAISATRIIRDPKERLRTMLVLPLMTCSARLPTYGLLIAAFFAQASVFVKAAIFVSLYFAGIIFAFIASLIIGKTVQRGSRSLPLVLEMPSYRIPQLRIVLRAATSSAKRFVRDVGTTIVLASVALWLLLKIPAPGASMQATADESATTVAMENSVAAKIGRTLEPITKPVGFDWRINVGLIGSFGARELMVSTLGVIFGIEGADDDASPLAEKIRTAKKPDGSKTYSGATGLALMAFFVFACQCMSTVAALRRETKSWKWPLFVLGYTYAVGYGAAFLVFHGARACGL